MMMNFNSRASGVPGCAPLGRTQTRLLALAYLSAFIPLTALAQVAERDPLNAQTVARPPYQSAFSDYQPYQDPELISWKSANDVVLEFGGMAGMADMNSSDKPEPSAGGAEPTNQPAKPSHDMSNMQGEPRSSAPKNAASPGSNPADMKNMPGHDMSKMKGAGKTIVRKSAPAHSMKGPGGMADMPGHDMDNMSQKSSPPLAPKPSPSPAKPSMPASMPGHSGMSQ